MRPMDKTPFNFDNIVTDKLGKADPLTKEQEDKWVLFFRTAAQRGVSEYEVTWALRMLAFRNTYEEMISALKQYRNHHDLPWEGLEP